MKLSSCSLLSFQTHFPFLLNRNARKDSSPFKEAQTVSVAKDLPKMSRNFVLFNVNRASGKLYSETVHIQSMKHREHIQKILFRNVANLILRDSVPKLFQAQ